MNLRRTKLVGQKQNLLKGMNRKNYIRKFDDHNIANFTPKHESRCCRDGLPGKGNRNPPSRVPLCWVDFGHGCPDILRETGHVLQASQWMNERTRWTKQNGDNAQFRHLEVNEKEQSFIHYSLLPTTRGVVHVLSDELLVLFRSISQKIVNNKGGRRREKKRARFGFGRTKLNRSQIRLKLKELELLSAGLFMFLYFVISLIYL